MWDHLFSSSSCTISESRSASIATGTCGRLTAFTETSELVASICMCMPWWLVTERDSSGGGMCVGMRPEGRVILLPRTLKKSLMSCVSLGWMDHKEKRETQHNARKMRKDEGVSMYETSGHNCSYTALHITHTYTHTHACTYAHTEYTEAKAVLNPQVQ